MQLPKYEDEKLLNKIQTQLANSPELIDYESIVELKKHLAALNQNESFLIIGGPCAEDIVFNSDYIKKTIETIITLSKNISQQTQHEVIYGGRIGGQFAKPRTEQYETIGNQTLPVYKGDMINHIDFTVTARTPKPELMIDGYTTSSKTIKLGKKLDPKFYFTHEALLIHYEEPQIKTKGSEHYLSSTHIPWIGERTRNADSAHVEFLRGIINPVGIKCSETTKVEELINIIRKLNPDNLPGKILLIIRMGKKIAEHLPKMIDGIKQANLNVIYICDPCHANIQKLLDGTKIRYFTDIEQEVKAFLQICLEHHVHPGGIHAELCGIETTECIGLNVEIDHVKNKYLTKCDPNMNKTQALALAKIWADTYNEERKKYENINS